MSRMKLETVSEQEIRDIAEIFADYGFEDDEKGLYYLCRNRDRKIDFVIGYARFCNYSNWFYTTGEAREGYICLQMSGDKPSMRGKLAFTKGIYKSMGFLGGIKFGSDYLKAGKPIEYLLRKDGFVHIRMLAVRKECQGQGVMGELLKIAFEEASRRNLPCIVSTDSAAKAARYEHYGFKYYNKRRLSTHSIEYDLIKY